MKKFIILIVMILLAGCEGYQPTDQHLSVILDLTDSESYQPDAVEVLSYLEKGHHSDGINLWLSYVAETRYGPTYQFSQSQGATGWLSNEDTRRRKLKLLLQKFSDTLVSINKDQKPSSRSEIFRLVVQQISHLSKQKGKRTLLLYSDLREHSTLMSVYDTKEQAKLLNAPEMVVKELSGKLDLPYDLSGITVHVLHTPKLEDDRIFTAMLGVYRQLFETLGADVQAGIHNQITFP